MTLPRVPPLLRLLALTLPLALAFGGLAFSLRGPAFFTAVPLPIPMGLGRPCKRAGGLDLGVNLRGGVNAVVTGVAAQGRGVGGPKTLPTRPIGDDTLELGICRHPQTLAEDVTRASPCFDKEVCRRGTPLVCVLDEPEHLLRRINRRLEVKHWRVEYTDVCARVEQRPHAMIDLEVSRQRIGNNLDAFDQPARLDLEQGRGFHGINARESAEALNRIYLEDWGSRC